MDQTIKIPIHTNQLLSESSRTTDQTLTPSRVRFDPLLSGDRLPGCFGDFIIDLNTLSPNKDYLPIDYDHNPCEILGRVGEWEITDTGLCATGLILPFRDGDRASEVLYKLRAGIPYEASVFVDYDQSTMIDLKAGETTTVNGRSILGPCTICYNVILRGLAVCPYGRDKNTTVEALSVSHNIKENQMDKKTKVTQLSDETVDTVEPGTDQETQPATAHPDLEELIEEFGLEKGVEYYREGISIEDAYKREHEDIKSARLAEEEKKGLDDTTNVEEKPDESLSDTKRIMEQLKTIVSDISKERSKLEALKSILKCGTDPVEVVKPVTKEQLSAVQRQAERITENLKL